MRTAAEEARRQLEPVALALEEARHRRAAGLDAPSASELVHRAGALARPDLFLALREQLATQADAGEAWRLRRLTDLVARLCEARRGADTLDELASLETSSVVPVGDQPVSLLEVLGQRGRASARVLRERHERAVAGFAREHHRAYLARVEAGLATAEQLGFASYAQLRDEVVGRAHAPVAEQAGAALVRSEDAYRDVLGYMLKRLDPKLRPASAAEHDLRAALAAPWVGALFSPGDLREACLRWQSELGLLPALQRVRVDAEDRPRKRPGLWVSALRVPEDVRVSVREPAGLLAGAAVLAGWGQSLSYLHWPAAAPVEERRLMDPAVVLAHGFAFEALLCDERWLRRYLRHGAAQAREAARVAAFLLLCELRRACGQLVGELALYAYGDAEEAEDAHARARARALGVSVTRGLGWMELSGQLDVARALEGRALADSLLVRALPQFNEDYWRNPGYARWLSGWALSCRGATTPAQMAQQLEAAEPQLVASADRLTRVMAV